MSLELIITLIVSFFIGYLGFIILLHNPKNFTNIFFFSICFFTILWSIVNYFSWISPPQNVLTWIRLVLFFAIFHIFSYYSFINNYPSEKLIFNKWKFLFFLIIIFSLATLTLSDKIFEKIIIKNGKIMPLPGKFMPLFAVFLLSMLAVGVVSSWKKNRILEERLKKEWMFISISLLTGYSLVIFTQFIIVNIFQNTNFIPYAPLFMLPVILGMGYSVIKYQALNIKIIGAEIFILLILSLFLINLIQSKTISDLVINLIIFIILFFISLMLIKSILIEIEQRKKLEELNRIKSEFLSFASHQLKSPLAVAKSYAELIIEKPEVAPEYAKKIKNSIEDLLVLIEEFLDYRRIEEGKIEFNFEEIDLLQFVKEMVEKFDILAKEKRLNFNFQTNLDSAWVKVDKIRFAQVIQNLIDNAIKYTKEGFVNINIERKNGFAIICVSDSGIGMSKELQTKLFGEFVRDPSVKKEIKGTGLGLYIAKHIIEAHNGKIWAESEGEGKGSKFYIKIPLLSKNI